MFTNRQGIRILVVDAVKSTHESFAFALSTKLKSSAEQVECFRLDYTYSADEALANVEDAASQVDGFAVAFIQLELGSDLALGGLVVADKIWKRDPLVQIVICTSDENVNWRSLIRSCARPEQLLLRRKPLHPDEICQLAISLSHRWSSIVDSNEKINHLQREIERRKQLEVELRRLVEQDALTKLPNRSILTDRINKILENRIAGMDWINAVLFMDLDNFKAINDSLGHQAGDEVLNQVANRLRKNIRLNSSNRPGRAEIVRLGGDEFVVLLEQFKTHQHAIKVAQRIVRQLAIPFAIGDQTVTIGSSVGVAFVTDDVSSADDILHNADSAMYRAKLRGKGQVAVFGEDVVHDRLGG
jgi:diguanylate cyclase (GGDEF)-like protein